MKQMPFADAEYASKRKQTCKELFHILLHGAENVACTVAGYNRGSRSAKSMRGARSSGRSRTGAAPTRNTRCACNGTGCCKVLAAAEKHEIGDGFDRILTCRRF